MNVIDGILGIIFLVNFILATLILIARGRGDGSASFAMAAYSTTLWIFSMFFFLNVNSIDLLILPTKLLYIAGILIAFSFFCFSYLFLGNTFRIRKRTLCLFGMPMIILLPIIWSTSFVISGVSTQGLERVVYFGPLYLPYSLILLYYFSFGYKNLIRKFSILKTDTVAVRQLLYILWGTFFSVLIGIIFDIIVPYFGKFEFYWIGPIMTIIFVLATSIAIFKHHLFDIKVIATELFAFLLALVVFINIFNYGTFSQLFFNILIFLGTSIFGVFLIRSVLWEVKTREELERLAADLSAANEQLTTLDKAKSEFIAIASHQLRTPLTAIKGYISLLMEGTYGVLREKQKKPMNGVFQSAERLIRLVNDLLSISRIESGKIEAKLAPTDIKKLIEGVIEELRVKVEGRGLTLDLKNSHGAMPVIMADEEKIRNVLMNIIDNAIRYTSRGGITVCLKLEEAERRIRIAIKDTGEGMTREEMSKLFESFSRGTAGQRIWTEGAGLGLYIAKKFIEMHKGRVWAESEGKGKGSEFVIELPL